MVESTRQAVPADSVGSASAVGASSSSRGAEGTPAAADIPVPDTEDEGERAEDAEGGLLENAALFGGDGGEKGGFDAKAQTGVVDAVVAKTSQDGAEEGQAFATLSGHRFLDPAFGFERLAQKPLKLRRGCEHANEHER